MSFFRGPNAVTNGLVFSIDFANVKSFSEDNSFINVSDWTISSGSTTNYTRNGQIYENERKLDTDPFGNQAIVWECIADSLNDGDGGWNTIPYTQIDNTKLYRFSVWVNRKVQGINGRFYLGCNGFNSSNSNVGVYYRSTGALTTNPYFWVSSNPPNSELPTGEWRLVVSHVWPDGSGVGTNHEDSGIYSTSSGTTKEGSISTDMVWMSANTQTRHRCYLFYNTGADAVQQMIYPRIEVCDGTEPTIEELLENSPNRAKNQVSKQESAYLLNNATYDSDGFGSINTNAASITDKGHITCDEVSFSDTQPYTLEFVVKLNPGAQTTFHGLVGRGATTPWISINGSAANFRFSFRELNATYNHSSYKNNYNISDNWLHVTLTADSSRVLKVYYNGEFFETLPTPTSSEIRINRIAGGYNSGDNQYNLQGKISIAKFYNRTLSDVEVLQNYNATKSRFGL